MTQARSEVINLDYTPYYHCISRCVRRAFLCGKDHYTGQSFEHRRQWIVDLIKELSQMFCIDIPAYGVMQNHFHIILHVDRKRCLRLSDHEVIERWFVFHRGDTVTRRFYAGGPVTKKDLKKVQQKVKTWRERLYNISWFMKLLNERIARRANREDHCRGKFWECRFKSQALLDEAALLTCMAYVDLNPIRAGLCESLEESHFTSIQERLKNVKLRKAKKAKDYLMPFLKRKDSEQKPQSSLAKVLPFDEIDYIQWVDYIGRVTRKGKRGAIPEAIQPIFNKLDMQLDAFLETMNHLETLFPVRMGQYATLVRYAEQVGIRWTHGFSHSRKLSQAA